MATPQIEHVVVLMLENRSFDSVLGWLYEDDEPALNIPPAAAGDRFHGLAGVDLSRFVNHSTHPNLTAEPTRGAEGFTVPTPDPGEEYEHVEVQLFGTKHPPPGATPTMTGVLEDYVGVMRALGYDTAAIAARAPSILQSCTPGQLPVLNQLARHYAVSDAWFSSVPSQTNPNRAFAYCGTSHGLVDNGELETDPRAKAIEHAVGMRIGDDRFPERTIFNAVHDAGKDWKVFWQTSYLPHKIAELLAVADEILPYLGAFGEKVKELQTCADYLGGLTGETIESNYTYRLFPAIQKIPDAPSCFADLDEFHASARRGSLPAFSFIEPSWTISQCGTETGVAKRLVTAMGNDYHPPANLLVGEDFVRSVYESLIADRDAWARTVLLITFDEFVGSFDHVPPPAAVPPWGKDGKPPFESPTGFKFDRLGVRVPTIVVSPWVQEGTVFRSTTDQAYDHTSIIATTLRLLDLDTPPSQFGARTATAPTFEGVLTLDEARTDAGAIPFLDVARRIDEPVAYGDQVALEYQDGSYVGAAKQARKSLPYPSSLDRVACDLGIAARFPTCTDHDGCVPLVFVSSSADPAGVGDGDQVWLVSKEPALGGDDVLGAWSDSRDCYWFDLYLDGDDAARQRWAITNVSRPDQPIRYGDQVRMVNRSTGHALVTDRGRWLSTARPDQAGTWTVLPYVRA